MKNAKRVLCLPLCFCLLAAAAPCGVSGAGPEAVRTAADGVFRSAVTIDFYLSDGSCGGKEKSTGAGFSVGEGGCPEAVMTDAAEKAVVCGGAVSQLSEAKAGGSVLLRWAEDSGGVLCGAFVDENGEAPGLISSLSEPNGGDVWAVPAGEPAGALGTLGFSVERRSGGDEINDEAAVKNGVSASVPAVMWVLLGVLTLLLAAAFVVLLVLVLKMRKPVCGTVPKSSPIPAADRWGVERKFVSPNAVPSNPLRPVAAQPPGEEPPCAFYPDSSAVRRMEISQSAPVQAIPMPPVYGAADDDGPVMGGYSEPGE